MGDFLASRDAPDAITPILGYRLWEVRGGRLCSLWFSAIPWAPQKKLRAACYEAQGAFPSAVLKRDRPLHGAPDSRCHCGLYAVSEPEDLPLEEERIRRAVFRVEEALDRVREVFGDELAPLALEHRIGLEHDALLELERPGVSATRIGASF